MNKNTILAIIQQSEYDYKYIADWLKRNSDDSVVKIEKKTPKLKIVSFLLSFLSFLPLLKRIKISLLLVKPLDFIIKQTIISIASIKLIILKLLGLKIVAISGSYGKTSVKHIMYYLLKSQLSVKMTPKSINTPIGIATYIIKNLDFSNKLFIAELGEYYRGDIKKLARFVRPDFGVVTPIGRQHLERMGNIDNIAATILELESFFDDKERVIISEQNQKFSLNSTFYGSSKKASIQAKNINIERRGTEFEVYDKESKNKFAVFMPLYGEHQAKNVLPSFWIAKKLKLNLNKLASQCFNLPFIYRRHEPTFADDNILILDNSYNTNPDSAKASLNLVNTLKPSRLIIVTMGFTELGKKAEKIHQEFGSSLAKTSAYLGLIKSPSTEGIIKGYLKSGGKRKNIVVETDMDTILKKTTKFYIPNSIVLIEGGYREIYT